MRVDDRSTSPEARRADIRLARWARLVALAVASSAVVLIAMAVPRWLVVLTPRWVIRGASIGVLWTVFTTYVLAIPAVLIGLVGSSLAIARARRRRDSVTLERSSRLLLLSAACLAGLSMLELGSAARLRWALRLPALPTQFEADRRSRSAPTTPIDANHEKTSTGDQSERSARPDEPLYLVVVGESSARGEPYHPWLSVGQLVAWQLEGVFPGRTVEVDIRAQGGLCLEQAVLLLKSLERRPDCIMVFAGHNEFVTRLGPSRNVRHYVEEGPLSELALLDLTRSSSSTARLVLQTLDSFYGERPPRLGISRCLIDHPSQAAKEYRFLCDDFSVRLDALAEYCTRIGSLPILIAPGSNDGSFEPNRSVLDGSTPADRRAAFEREFRAVRATESLDPSASIAAYRKLLDEHPEFAEAHYRLGRLLAQAGAWEDANHHFILARDLDGLALRCPSELTETYRSVAGRHGALLVDGPRVLARVAPHGILDDYLFHDAQHLNLRGIVALANDVLEQLKIRRAFAWPESTPAPCIGVDECARHFKLDAEKWSEVFRRSASFYFRTSGARFDPTERVRVGEEYQRAAEELKAGREIRESGIPSIALAGELL